MRRGARRGCTKGEVLSVSPIDDPLAYQRLLAGLDKAVFLEKEGL